MVVARLLDDLTVAVHYLVMAYIVFGGFLAWKWRWTIVTHVVFIGWAVFSLLCPITCPLTLLEDHFRHAGGLSPLNGGFIDTYITGVLYPASYTGLAQIIAGMIVLASWVGFTVRNIRRRHNGSVDRAAMG
jgi:uncharacterized protein DUF2784